MRTKATLRQLAPAPPQSALLAAAPSCSASALLMDIIWALLTYSRDTARRDWTISLARIWAGGGGRGGGAGAWRG
jgi:hypothetical protein